jgi:MFS family permease
MQNSGVGFVVGFGRVGAIAGPMIGGFLLSAGLGRMDTYFVFSAIAVIPVVTMYYAYRIVARAPHVDAETPAGELNAEPAR